MSARIDKSWTVLASYQTTEADRCVDVFARPDGTFGFEEFRLLPFFAKAIAEALTIHPKLNASIDAERAEATYHSGVHLAIAVDTDRGLSCR